ncbi:MAG: hypothetical protein MMC33_005223 [Icmadophila ericetorum]|nr:hypothetical protein [Icmadophila ericetorum]
MAIDCGNLDTFIDSGLGAGILHRKEYGLKLYGILDRELLEDIGPVEESDLIGETMGGGRVAHTQVLGWGSLMLQKSQQFGDIISEALLTKSTEPKQKVTEGSQLEESLEPDFGA